jgi:hypothetical protein
MGGKLEVPCVKEETINQDCTWGTITQILDVELPTQAPNSQLALPEG